MNIQQTILQKVITRNIMYNKIFKAGMLLLMMTIGGSSAWADTWNGTTKLTTIAAAGIEGKGTEAEPYIINTADKFVAFGSLANNSTAYWKLTADIDLGGHEWPYSGNSAKTFKGHFDGQNHIIKNYTITPISTKVNGLFGTVQGSSATNRAEIKNLKLDDVTITTTADLSSTTHIGALVGNSNQYVDFENIQIENVAGGDNNKTVEITLNNLTGNCNIGGLIGQFQKNSTIEDCTVNKPVILIQGEGAVKGTVYIGGAIGLMQGANATDVTKIDKPTSGSTNGLTVNDPSVTVHKILSTWYIASAIGRINNYSDVNYVTVKDPTLVYKAVGSPGNALYLGTLTGHIQGNVGSATVDPVSTPVKNISITGTSLMTIGTGSEEIKNVKAGIVGQATTNVDIDNWNIATSNITVNGSLTTSADYFGGVIGHVQSATTVSEKDAATKVKNVTLANSTISLSGTIGKESYIGGAFGRIEGTAGNASKNQLPQQTVVTNVNITGTSSLNICTSNSNIINYVRAGGVAGMATTNVKLDDWIIANTDIKINGKLQTTASSVGGCIGVMQSTSNAPAKATNIQVTTSSAIAINGDVEKEVYVGGAFGRMDGSNSTQNQPATAENVNINGLNMTFGGDFTQHVYAGGVVGYLYSMNTTSCPNPTSVVNCSAKGQIHSNGSKTFKEGMTYAFGGIVGYNNQNNTTNQSIIKQCVSEVDFNLSGYTPATATNLTKTLFIVGGVIGRLDNPSLLPEHLYYSGKIYAPYAAVGPVVGTFYKNAGAQYVYEDYSGEYAAPTLTSQEWEKANTWYYNDYKIGLSSDVRTQTARTRNYSDSDVDGEGYLTITDQTFSAQNTINGGKLSQTVLRYTANNQNVDFGIFPQWATSSSAYPTYYMYYMQGVNRGVYMENEQFAKELINKKVTVSASMQTEQTTGNYTFTTSLGGIQNDANFTKTYQWYQSDESTAIDGKTSNTITLTESELTTYGGTVYCKITVSGTGFSNVIYTLKGSNAYVVFVDGAKGVDNIGASKERGWTPETAVKTINHANSLLRTGGTVDNNIIVVIGTLNSDGDFRSDGKNPATITGRYDGKDYAGIIKIKQINAGAGNDENSVNPINPSTGAKGSNCYVQADTKFEYLTFQANSANDGNNFIELHGNDVTFGKGLSMTNFRNLTKNHGNLEAAQNIPELTIVLTATNLNEATIQRYTNREKPQVVTFESGRYGRIMGGRYTNGFFAKPENNSHTILGSAEHPVWAIVNVNIDKNNPNVGTINRGEAPSTGTVTNSFTCDINCIIAGLTDGSMYGDYEINVRGGKVGYIVGGNQGNPVPNGSKTFTQPGGKSGNWGQWPNATYFGRTVINVKQDVNLKDIVIDNLYAGGLGREANGGAATSIVDMYMYGHTEINMMSGTVTGNVYGGGAGGVIGLNPWDMHLPYATAEADNATNAIMNKVQYCAQGVKPADDAVLASVTLHNSNGSGGYNTEQLNLGTSSTTLNISGGTIHGSVYGGGCGYVSNMPKEVCMQGVGSVFGTSNVNVTGGTINGSVYGGSEGSDKYYGATNKYNQKITNIAEMNGMVNLTISGNSTTYPTINGNVYGAGKGITSTKTEEYLRIATTGNAVLGDTYKSSVNITVDLPNNVEFPFDIYGGGEMGKVDGNINITLKGGKLIGNVYGGGLGEAAHVDKAMVTGNTTINMTAEGSPAHPLSIGKNESERNMYGGGNLAQLKGNTTLNLNHGSISGNVYGGGKGLSKAESGSITDYGKVTGSSTITMNNATADTSISGDIFGGGALGELTGNTQFTIENGTVNGYVYGGGALANVGGNTDVKLHGGSVAGAYGGGLGSNDVAAIVGGNATVTLGKDAGEGSYVASKVTGAGLFGCNNLNGTPKGHAKVHVLHTTSRGQDPETRNIAGTVANFDVAAVYGGGNKAAYEPTAENEKAEVLIENCDNSIAYVYGGGNAAPVPATDVTILGANAIDNAFAGGNGEGTGNLGADIGYLGYARDDTHKYGSGTAAIQVYGGTIHNLYGGSNTLGYIRTATSVKVEKDNDKSTCEINVTNTFGGGNKAEMTCDITADLTCNEGVKVFYAGANQANILGNATINIHSGVYEQIFGGNNQSGVIKGKLTINVDETGCWPVMIGELYGCGNDAPYSVYGYNADNTPRTSLAGLTQGVITQEGLPYGDPEINVISCTKIGRIFGGGYSSGATVYGNTHVNVNLIPGRWNGQKVTPKYKLDSNYQMVDNSEAIAIPSGIGEIGNIYGGGNVAGVVGNTYVNIYTNKYNSHIENSAPGDYIVNKTPQESGVNILGDVFGGSKGSASNPDAGKVTGTTNVLIGYE